MKLDSSRESEFAELIKEAKGCDRCPRMRGSVRVIGPASGSIEAPILIIGEAPGRLGADASAIPFHGDKAGDNFEKLLEQVGLSRHECFITNAALCNPKDDRGNNSTPTKIELKNCSGYLRRQIDLVNPKIVVTLGSQALNAIRSIEDHEIDLSSGVRKDLNWYGRKLVVLYHPGQRAMIHRSFFNKLADYQFLSEVFRRASRRVSNVAALPSTEIVARIVRKLTGEPEGISYFSLHKLFYLAEYEFFRRHKRRMTSAYIVRQKDGPYVFEMHIKKLTKAIKELEVWTEQGRLMLRSKDNAPLLEALPVDEFDDVLSYVSGKYARLSESNLKRVVYLTSPMRRMLKREKHNENMFNRAIDFSIL